MEEFENSLEVRKRLTSNIDIANSHRYLGETLQRLNENDRAKCELEMYFSITLKLNDLVEIERAHTTLGNYYMSLTEEDSPKSFTFIYFY